MAEPFVLDGKALAKLVEAQLAERAKKIIEKTGRVPVLATILVGDNPASVTYVRMKGNACRRIGIDSRKVELSGETTTEELLAVIEDKPRRKPAERPSIAGDAVDVNEGVQR